MSMRLHENRPAVYLNNQFMQMDCMFLEPFRQMRLHLGTLMKISVLIERNVHSGLLLTMYKSIKL